MTLFFAPFSVIQQNVQSIKKKVQWLKCPLFSKAEVFVFQEIFLKEGDSFSYPGMVIYRQDRTSKGDGLVIAVNNKFPSVLIDLTSYRTQNVEALRIKIWIDK